MPVHIPTRRSSRSVRATGKPDAGLVLVALTLVLLIGLAAAKRPSDADIVKMPVEIAGP